MEEVGYGEKATLLLNPKLIYSKINISMELTGESWLLQENGLASFISTPNWFTQEKTTPQSWPNNELQNISYKLTRELSSSVNCTTYFDRACIHALGFKKQATLSFVFSSCLSPSWPIKSDPAPVPRVSCQQTTEETPGKHRGRDQCKLPGQRILICRVLLKFTEEVYSCIWLSSSTSNKYFRIYFFGMSTLSHYYNLYHSRI